MIDDLNVNRERIAALVIVSFFLLTTIYVSTLGQSLFVIIFSTQLTFLLMSCYVEYLTLSTPTDAGKKGLSTRFDYAMLFFVILTTLVISLFDIFVGIDNVDAFMTTIGFNWFVIIAWLLGKVVVKQVYILRYQK